MPKMYYSSRKEAMAAAESQNLRCFKVKSGRNKGKYFVGTWLAFASWVQ